MQANYDFRKDKNRGVRNPPFPAITPLQPILRSTRANKSRGGAATDQPGIGATIILGPARRNKLEKPAAPELEVAAGGGSRGDVALLARGKGPGPGADAEGGLGDVHDSHVPCHLRLLHVLPHHMPAKLGPLPSS